MIEASELYELVFVLHILHFLRKTSKTRAVLPAIKLEVKKFDTSQSYMYLCKEASWSGFTVCAFINQVNLQDKQKGCLILKLCCIAFINEFSKNTTLQGAWYKQLWRWTRTLRLNIYHTILIFENLVQK